MSILDLFISSFFIGIVILIWGSLMVSHYFNTLDKTKTDKKSAFLLTIVETVKVIFIALLMIAIFYYITGYHIT